MIISTFTINLIKWKAKKYKLLKSNNQLSKMAKVHHILICRTSRKRWKEGKEIIQKRIRLRCRRHKNRHRNPISPQEKWITEKARHWGNQVKGKKNQIKNRKAYLTKSTLLFTLEINQNRKLQTLKKYQKRWIIKQAWYFQKRNRIS